MHFLFAKMLSEYVNEFSLTLKIDICQFHVDLKIFFHGPRNQFSIYVASVIILKCLLLSCPPMFSLGPNSLPCNLPVCRIGTSSDSKKLPAHHMQVIRMQEAFY